MTSAASVGCKLQLIVALMQLVVALIDVDMSSKHFKTGKSKTENSTALTLQLDKNSETRQSFTADLFFPAAAKASGILR